LVGRDRERFALLLRHLLADLMSTEITDARA